VRAFAVLLDGFQIDAIQALEARRSVLVSAPTGAAGGWWPNGWNGRFVHEAAQTGSCRTSDELRLPLRPFTLWWPKQRDAVNVETRSGYIPI
jgi:hypothetical protein